MARVLVIRLSALGDVAMLVPVVASVAERYPQDRFYVMTRVAFTPLFNNLSFNVNTISVDVRGKHKGFFGLLKLVFKSVFMGFSHVVDEHDVLRSKLIRWAIMLTGRKVRHIDKGRKEKQQMIESKVLNPPLKHTVDRYLDTFVRLGFPAEISFNSILDYVMQDYSIIEKITGKKEGKWIGIAPFARHEGKMYPLEKMERVVEMLSKEAGTTVFLLGGGRKEKHVLDEWQSKYAHTINLTGQLNLEKELQVMSMMDVVVSMDSANMHLASLVNTPVVSIWGATHPSLGFYGFRQDIDNAIQMDLPYRPTSVFGDAPCDEDCMKGITEQMVVDKIHQVMNKK
ncbi:glycosyltransferase family 9 protein [Dysgonomonas sp. 25]|uniref:glycosyltransferase family 9 protein n=1 Tax=Dysgonomonas sp. 25 TaxID=2302933 RepID=UPI0013D75CE3|nr:glycosyltransferase family 9 protein [Dysgonomonas sp. 25]NDV68894.1 lipopolysaccharide heptosyltransferase family protein [Dysgonomonas sp. 25]